MKIYNWTNFLENRAYDNPPDFDKEQIDWLSHSINNPNNFIKNFAELSLEILEDDINKILPEDINTIKSNIKKVISNSNDIQTRISGLSKVKKQK